jgi:hypothetical protein
MKTDPERPDALSSAAQMRLAELLSRDEHVLFVARPHPMFANCALLCAAAWAAFVIVVATSASIVPLPFEIPALFVAGFFIPVFVMHAVRAAAHVRQCHAIVTDRRSFALEGATAQRLETIGAAGEAMVKQTAAGRIFDFGTIVTEGGVKLPCMRKPAAFHRALQRGAVPPPQRRTPATERNEVTWTGTPAPREPRWNAAG